MNFFRKPSCLYRYTPLSARFRRMAWISRTVFASESDDKDEDERLREEPVEEKTIEPKKKKEKKLLAASSAYELLKLFYF